MSADNCTLLDTIAKCCQIIAGLGTISILWYTLQSTMKLSRESKCADVLMECNRRFDHISEIRMATASVADPLSYYQRFWSVQHDQFRFWQMGFIHSSTFRYFMQSRYYEWAANKSVGTISYREAWNTIKGNWASSDFTNCMDDVFAGTIDEAMKKYRSEPV